MEKKSLKKFISLTRVSSLTIGFWPYRLRQSKQPVYTNRHPRFHSIIGWPSGIGRDQSPWTSNIKPSRNLDSCFFVSTPIVLTLPPLLSFWCWTGGVRRWWRCLGRASNGIALQFWWRGTSPANQSATCLLLLESSKPRFSIGSYLARPSRIRRFTTC